VNWRAIVHGPSGTGDPSARVARVSTVPARPQSWGAPLFASFANGGYRTAGSVGISHRKNPTLSASQKPALAKNARPVHPQSFELDQKDRNQAAKSLVARGSATPGRPVFFDLNSVISITPSITSNGIRFRHYDRSPDTRQT
jgi:hypothetical protein